MKRAARLEPFEILTAERLQDGGNAPPDALVLKPRREQADCEPTITPLGAFACGAVIVSALALAYNLGRNNPLALQPATQLKTSTTLEEIRNRQPINYENLEVDRGDAR